MVVIVLGNGFCLEFRGVSVYMRIGAPWGWRQAYPTIYSQSLAQNQWFNLCDDNALTGGKKWCISLLSKFTGQNPAVWPNPTAREVGKYSLPMSPRRMEGLKVSKHLEAPLTLSPFKYIWPSEESHVTQYHTHWQTHSCTHCLVKHHSQFNTSYGKAEKLIISHRELPLRPLDTFS